MLHNFYVPPLKRSGGAKRPEPLARLNAFQRPPTDMPSFTLGQLKKAIPPPPLPALVDQVLPLPCPRPPHPLRPPLPRRGRYTSSPTPSQTFSLSTTFLALFSTLSCSRLTSPEV
jgi:hypothetical protein